MPGTSATGRPARPGRPWPEGQAGVDRSRARARDRRSSHHARRAGSRWAYRSRSSSSGSGGASGTADRPPVDIGRLGRDVTGQQGPGAEPARQLQPRQGAGQRQFGRHADTGLDRGRHDDGQADPRGHRQRAAHAAKGRALEDGDVRGARPRDGQGVLRAADRLVRGDRHVRAGPQVRQLPHTRARLLGVLQAARRLVEDIQRTHRLVDGPPAVGVDADVPAGSQRLAHGRDAGGVRGQAPTRAASATLTFAVPQPEPRTISAARSGPPRARSRSADPVADGLGHPSQAASSAAASHVAATSSSYSANGQKSPQPRGPRSNTPSRTVMPRNRSFRGMAYTCSAPVVARFSAASGTPAGNGKLTGSAGCTRRG